MDINFIITNGKELPNDADLFFGDMKGVIHEPVVEVAPDKDMYDLLVMADVFPSKGQARKNWAKTGADIPKGYSEFKVGKLKSCICVLNPI